MEHHAINARDVSDKGKWPARIHAAFMLRVGAADTSAVSVIWKPACKDSLTGAEAAEATALRLQLLTVAVIWKPACSGSLTFWF